MYPGEGCLERFTEGRLFGDWADSLICKALTGPKFLLENGLEKERVDGPPSETSPTVVVHYRIASAQGARLGVFNGEDAILPIEETPEDWANRMTGKLFGLRKEELASVGGGDAFVKWVRSEDDDEATWSRVFWDTMLLIYLLEGNPKFRPRADALLTRSRKRGDSLYTSHLALGEIMAGAERFGQPLKVASVRKTLDEMGFRFLPFDAGAVQPFSSLRGRQKIKIADAIHLASAASAGIDLYLTGDTQLFKLDVPGIQFIADFNSNIF